MKMPLPAWLLAFMVLSVTAFGASFVVSPTSVAGSSTGNVITLTGTATAWTGLPFTLSGGEKGIITNQAVTSATTATITINPGIQGYTNLVVLDTISGATAGITVTAPVLGPLVIGYIGDSITEGINGFPTTAAETYLTNFGYTVTTVNRGISSTSTADWIGSAAYPGTGGGGLGGAPAKLNNAIAAFNSAGVTLVHIMLGTNDPYVPYGVTLAQHAANMRSIVGTLVSSGFTVVISKPIWTIPNINPNRINDSGAYYLAAFAKDMLLVDGRRVFQGDTTGYAQSFLTPATFLTSDGVHPTAAGNTLLGNYWAVAILNQFGNQVNNPPKPAGVAGSSNGPQ